MKKILITIISIFSFFLLTLNTKALNGIDISEFQGDIDFNRLKEENIDIIYIRSSASFSYKDAKFERNYKYAKEAGFKIGFYHYLTARTENEARKQARFFASVIAEKQADCRLAMDFETFGSLTKEEINRISIAFLSELERITKKELVVYSDAYNTKVTFDKEIAKKYPLWVAEYGPSHPTIFTWDKWIGWQYTDKGRLKGINGYVDRDEFKEEIFLSDNTAIVKPDLKESEKKKIIYYRIKKGDNLTKIAQEYNVTVNDLIKWNNILFPDLIFPDSILKIITDYDKYTTSTNEDTYKVKWGDTLYGISRKYHVSIASIVSLNNIKNPNLIFPGETLKIRQTTNEHTFKYTIKRGDTLSYLAKAYQTSIYELQKINHITNINHIEVGTTIYIPDIYIILN